MALSNLSSAHFPIKRRGLDRTSAVFKPYPLCNMAPRCCPYQSGAGMLSRPHTVVDLEAATLESGSLVRCRFSRLVALGLCSFSAFRFFALGLAKHAGSTRPVPCLIKLNYRYLDHGYLDHGYLDYRYPDHGYLDYGRLNHGHLALSLV